MARGIFISIHALLAESDKLINDPAKTTVLFLSTLSLRRATACNHQDHPGQHHFYPRSPCGERLTERNNDKESYRISIHALLAESDGTIFRNTALSAFYFYPRSPCGERRTQTGNSEGNSNISIHALLAESDSSGAPRLSAMRNFYPRSPCGERPSRRT